MRLNMRTLAAVVSRPGPTLGGLAREKRWMTALVIILLTVAVISYITLPGRLAESRQLLEESGLVDTLATDGGWMRLTPLRRWLLSLWTAFVSAMIMMVAAFLTYLFYGVGGAEGDYANFFALIVNASLIGMAIPQLIGLFGMMSGLPLLHFLNPGFILPVSRDSLAFFVLARFDVIYIWYLTVVALGAAHFTGLSKRRSLIIITLYFIFVSLVRIAFAYLRVQLTG